MECFLSLSFARRLRRTSNSKSKIQGFFPFGFAQGQNDHKSKGGLSKKQKQSDDKTEAAGDGTSQVKSCCDIAENTGV